jgi:hypothetical protein
MRHLIRVEHSVDYSNETLAPVGMKVPKDEFYYEVKREEVK